MLEDAPVDASGKQTIRKYLDAFFDVLEHDAAFYRPVVVGQNAKAFLDAEARQPLCDAADSVPVGTPVTAPLREAGTMVEVRQVRRQPARGLSRGSRQRLRALTSRGAQASLPPPASRSGPMRIRHVPLRGECAFGVVAS